MLHWKIFSYSHLITTCVIITSIDVSCGVLSYSEEAKTTSAEENTLHLKRSTRSHATHYTRESSSNLYSHDVKSNDNDYGLTQRSLVNDQHIAKNTNDYEGRLGDSFFKHVKRSKDYDRNEVPWEGEKGSKPVEIQMSAYLRKVFIVVFFASKTILLNVITTNYAHNNKLCSELV